MWLKTGLTLLLSEVCSCFGNFQDFVNIVLKDCGEVRSGVPGDERAQGNFTHVFGVLHVPDLWHAAAGPALDKQQSQVNI